MASVPVEERLFSLVLALLATETGLTKNEILSTVQGYRQRYDAHSDNASLERQFERDKDDIRELGVPLETLDTPGEPGNNQSLRYRIPRTAYELPADISFSDAETTLLNLAAMAWREGSLSRESRRAMLKLRSIGVETSDPVLGYAPRIRTRDAAFAPLGDALAREVTVSFAYLKPGDPAARLRTVMPLALVQHQGRWHLKAHDLDADAPRTFLLSRITGSVKVGRTGIDVPPADHAALALAELDVRPGTDAAVRLARRRGASGGEPGERMRVHFTDVTLLADELAGFGPEVRVVSPAALRDAVLDRLRAAVRENSGSPEAA
ncbi:MAG: WYL domain-containing protein [Herbiconiux sp.]|nr:WYL domain-containing protein [Herbiconiux sp.]